MDWKNQVTKTPYVVLFIVLIAVGAGTSSTLITITLTGDVAIEGDLDMTNSEKEKQGYALNLIAPDGLQLIPEAQAQAIDCSSSKVNCKEVILTAQVKTVLLPTGDPIELMSFDGQYPAPTIRVTEGDIVQITIVNDGPKIHSIDHHGAQLSAVPNFGPVLPGQEQTYTFVAANPGVFVYHCEANNVFGLDEHALQGMTGMLIVDPKSGYESLTVNAIVIDTVDSNFDTKRQKFNSKAKEFSLLYSEWYLTTELSGDRHVYDKSKMFNKDPTYSHVNGVPFGYLGTLLSVSPWNGDGIRLSDVIPPEILLDCAVEDTPLEEALCNDSDNDGNLENDPLIAVFTTPGVAGELFGPGSIGTHLDVNKGDHVRFFVLNVGDRQVPWHIVGEQIDRVAIGDNIMAEGIQTWNVAPYSDAIFDVVFEQPGVYAIVNHDYSSLFRGHASIMVVHDPDMDPASCGEDVLCIVIAGEAKNNPSNTLPPLSDLRNTSIDQTETECTWGIGAETPNAFTTECAPI